MTQKKIVQVRRVRRQKRVRSNITGTAETPRLSVFRSSMHIYAQLIDDVNGVTLASASSNDKAIRTEVDYGGNIAAARVVGQKLAVAATAKGITKASFDRGYYRFHGRVQALAEAATAAGLKCSGELKVKKVRVEKEAPKAKAKSGGGGGDNKKKK